MAGIIREQAARFHTSRASCYKMVMLGLEMVQWLRATT